MRLLGIDYGEAKIGLAIGDTESRMSLPYKILKNSGLNNFLIELKNICQTEKIEKIILGLPINKQAQFSRQTQAVKNFGEELKKQMKLEIIFQNESFSSQEAQKLKPGKNDDDLAAMLILQGYLDAN